MGILRFGGGAGAGPSANAVAAKSRRRRSTCLRGENAHGPRVATLAQAMPKLRARSVSGIRQNAAEAHAGGTNPIDLVECDAPLRPIAHGRGDLRLIAARTIVGP